MTKMVEIAFTAVATLIGTGIVASVAWIVRRRGDVVRLSGTLASGPALPFVESVGCPCLTLTVTNRVKRVAKIKAATLSLRNADVVEDFQEGFGDGLGLTSRLDKRKPLATLGIGLLPITKPTSPQGWNLERDDICQFILPLLTSGLGLFHASPSQDLSVKVEFFDDSEYEVLRGDEILQAIRLFVEMYRDHPYQLNANITIPISLRVRSTALPDPSLIGTTNPRAIVMQPRPNDKGDENA